MITNLVSYRDGMQTQVHVTPEPALVATMGYVVFFQIIGVPWTLKALIVGSSGGCCTLPPVGTASGLPS